MISIDFIHDTTFESLPKSTIKEAVRCFVDTVGVAVGGSQTQVAHIIHNHAACQFDAGRRASYYTYFINKVQKLILNLVYDIVINSKYVIWVL